MIRHTSKVRDKTGFQKIEEKDKQFLIENYIRKIENKNAYEIKTEKEPENMLKIEKNYRVCRCVYQALFYKITETFIQCVNTLASDKIEQLDADLKANGWGVKLIVEIEDCIEILKLFQLFCYFNRRLPLTNGLLPIPDGETRDGSKKISLKNFYEMFKDTDTHELVSVQFLSALNLFFSGDIQLSKDRITELYKSLSLKTFSRDGKSSLTKYLN